MWKKINIRFHPAQLAKLQRIAKKKKLSIAEIIRQVVDSLK